MASGVIVQNYLITLKVSEDKSLESVCRDIMLSDV